MEIISHENVNHFERFGEFYVTKGGNDALVSPKTCPESSSAATISKKVEKEPEKRGPQTWGKKSKGFDEAVTPLMSR